MEIKAIPTKYNGITFRSRLEAQWAVFFDMLGWQWEYEPFDMNGYIPDFIIKANKEWVVDIKPLSTMDELNHRAKDLLRIIGTETTVIFLGRTIFESSFSMKNAVDIGKVYLVGRPESSIFDNDIITCFCTTALCENCGNIMFFAFEDAWECPFCLAGGDNNKSEPSVNLTHIWYDAKRKVMYKNEDMD